MAYLFSILAGLYFQMKNLDFLPYLVLGLLSLGFLLSTRDQEGKKKLAICLGLFLLFYVRGGLPREEVPRPFQGQVQGKVLDCLKKETSYQVKLKFTKTGQRALVYSKRPMDRGSTWIFRGDFKLPEEATDSSGPFYGDYLRSQGIQYLGFAQGLRQVKEPGFFDWIQNKILHKLEEGPGLSQESQALFNQVVLSRKTSSFWSEDLRDLGLAHILAISGLHIGLLYQGVFLVLALFFSKNKSQWLAFFMACLYLAFIQGSVSGFRVLCFLFFSILGKQRALRLNFDHIFLFLFGLQLFLLPRYFYSQGFYLSYAAYFAIHRLTPYCQRLFAPFDNNLTQAMAASLAVLIGILPLSLAMTYEVNLAQVLANVFLLPLYTGFICLSFVYALVLLLGLPLGLLAYIINSLGEVLVLANRGMATYLPLRVVFGKPSLEASFLFYLALYLFIYGRDFCKSPLVAKSIFVFSLSLFLTSFINPSKDQGLYFIYVGQGDSSLIWTKSSQTLIDTGGSRNYRPGQRYTLPFLKSRGISHLDQVVITHWDEDHSDGLKDLLGQVDLGKIYSGYFPEEVRDFLDQYGLSYQELKEGDRLFLGEGAYLDVVFTNPQEDKENNKSLVLLYKDQARTFLFPGDMEKEVEDQLYLKPVDVYHVAHHGSKTSSTPRLLAQIQPKLSFISAGKDNPHGHPHEVTIQNLEEVGTKIYSLKDSGSLKLDPKSLQVQFTRTREALEGKSLIAYTFVYFIYLIILEGGCRIELSKNRTGNGGQGLGPPIW